jgi:hypothetical protein
MAVDSRIRWVERRMHHSRSPPVYRVDRHAYVNKIYYRWVLVRDNKKRVDEDF